VAEMAYFTHRITHGKDLNICASHFQIFLQESVDSTCSVLDATVIPVCTVFYMYVLCTVF
jgi:hypothetical protein